MICSERKWQLMHGLHGKCFYPGRGGGGGPAKERGGGGGDSAYERGGDKTRQDKTMFYLECYTVLCTSTLSK